MANLFKMDRYRRLTLLHSNDLHGDFFAEQLDEKLVGGVSMLSGYINKVREEEPNVIYAIAGDMFRGSVIDSEYQGLSTIQIMNMLAPDVVTIGNHETDYGLAHLLFIEKLAQFPIINSNLYIKSNGVRLFRPCHIIEIDGMKVLFIGILTSDVIAQTKSDGIIGSYVDVEEAAHEVGKICNTYNAIDIDFTVLLTHIGFEEDKKLASMLDPAYGVDIIIGGHSHTYLEEPAIVNNILIVQAGMGTDQIGRFDIVVDTETNDIESYKWQSIPINAEHCPRNEQIEELIDSIKGKTDLKYGRVVTHFAHNLTHPDRWQQTGMGGLFADVMKNVIGCDVFLMGSGSIRLKQMGPVMTYQNFVECYPYAGPVYMVTMTGAQFRKCMLHIYRDEAWLGDHTEFFQLSEGMHCVYSKSRHEFDVFTLNGREIEDDDRITVGVQNYHYLNMEDSFGLSLEELKKNAPVRMVCTNDQEAIEEYMGSHHNMEAAPVDRLELLD